MKPFCEVIAFEVLPAVRAMVARQLMEKYKVSQVRAARLIGVSQPAISQYKRDLRGYRTGLFKNNPSLVAMVERIAEGLASGEIKDMESTLSFCKLCKEIRFSGVGCELHGERDASVRQCNICIENPGFYGKAPEKNRAMGRIKKLTKF